MSGSAADEPRAVGIFGGTFDPPHLGHSAVAADVADALDLDEVLWIPAGEPPHKTGDLTPSDTRLRMVRAAVGCDDRFRVSELEIRRDGPSYTVDTLRTLRDGPLADARIYLIMGVDQYRDFSDWHRPDAIRRMATLAVMDRAGEGVDGERADEDADLVRVPVRRVDVSSTEVREMVGRGEDVSALVDPEVARIIDAEGLYQSFSGRSSTRGSESP